MYDILDKYKFPDDMKNLDESEIEKLAEEIREFLIEKVSKTGGHLASNLGVVELTLSLHKNFDFSKDKIVWDVGHQSYVHKILTGRKDGFDTLRKYGGLSGFPKRCESEYDCFDTGHSSTSISAALGMARARDIKGEKHSVIAVIGDGALTGGMAFEALNDVGDNKTDLIVILNDNEMSISKNVGGLSRHLSKIRVGTGYNKFKEEVNSTLNVTPIGKGITNSLSKIKDSIKQLIVPSMLFEDMGVKYIGPIDGHNLKELNFVLSKAKEISGPVLIHTVTQKGRGYNYAEENPNKFHGVGPFNSDSGEMTKSGDRNYSNAFGSSLIEIAKEDPDVVAITAAMPDGTGLKKFAQAFPKRLFDVGIAEQHAVTLSAGMASSGLKPVFAVYSTFLQRAYDQVLHDVAIQKLPVVFAIDRAGIVGEDGETHQGIFDVSFLSAIPNMTIIAPKCIEEVDSMLRWAINYNSPVAIRYPRGGDKISLKPMESFEYGKWETIENGEKVAVISYNKMVQNCYEAVKELNKKGINPLLINASFIKPIDNKLLAKLSKNGYNIIVVEESIEHGGLGTAVLEYLNEIGFTGKFLSVAYKDKFIPHGEISVLYKKYGLDAESIKHKILELWF